jgi:hypothetical protein
VGGAAGKRTIAVDALLGQTNLGLQLSPWVGRGGGRRQSAERSCRFVECADGSLVVDLGGGGAAPSSVSSVSCCQLRVGVVPLCWVISLAALVPHFAILVVLGSIPNSLIS